MREARRSELHLARVRGLLIVVVAGVELYWTVMGEGVPWPLRIPTVLYLVFALATWLWLGRGRWSPWLSHTLPLVDLGFLTARMEVGFRYHSLAVLRQDMALAVVLGGIAVVVLTTALRMSRPAVVAATGVGVGIYLHFAAMVELTVPERILQASFVVAVGAVAWMVTRTVERAVRGEVQRLTLSRFLHPSVLARADQDPVALLTEARQAEATILFTDIRGFTRWAEDRDPLLVLHVLNRIQGELARQVEAHMGTVDKFMGDGMLAVFGAPALLPDHADQALAAVRAMRAQLPALLRDADGASLSIGYGVHSGTVVAGCLGSGARLEFTVLGDAVNLASRLEGLTKTAGHEVLVSGETVALLSDRAGLRRLDTVTLPGRDGSVEVWSLDAQLEAPARDQKVAQPAQPTDG